VQRFGENIVDSVTLANLIKCNAGSDEDWEAFARVQWKDLPPC
jgi:hypothetical protein